MTIVSVRDIEPQDLAVHYRRAYFALVEIHDNDHHHVARVEFSLELTALGRHDVSVQFVDTPEFAERPAIELLASEIRTLDAGNQLP